MFPRGLPLGFEVHSSVSIFGLRRNLDSHKWYKSLDLTSLLYEIQGPSVLHQIQQEGDVIR